VPTNHDEDDEHINMSAQYAFFRDPTGRAAKRAEGKHAPTQLLAKIGSEAVLQENGAVAWSGSWDTRDALIRSLIVLGRDGVELNQQDAQEIVWTAIQSVVKTAPGKPLKANDVLGTADKLAAAYFRRHEQSYVLVGSLSVKDLPARTISIRGCQITSLASRGPQFPLPKVLESRMHRDHFAGHLRSSHYRLVKVACVGRTVHAAVDNALVALNLLRAVWSYAATYGRETKRLGGGPWKPIGVIHSGPVQTLHNPDGTSADDRFYWFDPSYTRDHELFRKDDKWKDLEKVRKWVSRRLAILPYKREMEEILIRYITALDQANPHVAFLHLWGILEKITNTAGGKYDETIERACRVYRKQDRPVVKETLESLRHYRNQYVHAGNAGHDGEEAAYRVKSFVDPHLTRLLHNPYRMKSLSEYGEVLSYPTAIDALQKMRTWSSMALRTAKSDCADEA
jgi:hypothetical protein